jgi:hypothetical protein
MNGHISLSMKIPQTAQVGQTELRLIPLIQMQIGISAGLNDLEG